MLIKKLKFNERVANSRFSSVQSLSHVWLFATPWITARWASLSITNSQSLLKLMSIKLVMPSSHLILYHSPSPPAPNPSQHQGLFQWVNSSYEGAKVLKFQLQPMNTQDWSPLGWTGWISLQPKGLSESSPTPQFKRDSNSSTEIHVCLIYFMVPSKLSFSLE